MGITNSDATNTFDESLVSDILNRSAVQSTLNVTTVAQELKVGASRLVDRKAVMIMPLGNNVYYGFASGSQPFPIFKNQLLFLPIGSGLEIWLKTSSSSASVVVAEAL